MKIINWGKGKLKVQNGNQEITVAETGEVLESNSSEIPKGTDLLSPKKQIKNRAETKVESTTPKELSELIENFDKQIFSPEGILINGKNYKLQFEQNLTQNKGKK